MRYASRVSFRPQTKCAMEGLVSARRGFCRAVRASHACPTFPQGREKGADTERSCGGALGAASGQHDRISSTDEMCDSTDRVEAGRAGTAVCVLCATLGAQATNQFATLLRLELLSSFVRLPATPSVGSVSTVGVACVGVLV